MRVISIRLTSNTVKLSDLELQAIARELMRGALIAQITRGTAAHLFHALRPLDKQTKDVWVALLRKRVLSRPAEVCQQCGCSTDMALALSLIHI